MKDEILRKMESDQSSLPHLFLTQEFARFVYTSDYHYLHNKEQAYLLGELISLSGSTLRAANEGKRNSVMGAQSYMQTLVTGVPWRNEIFRKNITEFREKNNSRKAKSAQKNKEQQYIELSAYDIKVTTLVYPSSSPVLEDNLNNIVQALLGHAAYFSRNIWRDLDVKLMHELASVVSNAFLAMKHGAQIDFFLEKELLESFNHSNFEAFADVMKKIGETLCHPQYRSFFPEAFYAIVESDVWNNWVQTSAKFREVLKETLFYPVLTQSGYMQHITDASIPLKERIEVFEKINFQFLPEEVKIKLARNASVRAILEAKQTQNPYYRELLRDVPFSRWESLSESRSLNAARLILTMKGNIEGAHHFMRSMSATELLELLEDKKFLHQLEETHSSLSNESDKKKYESFIFFLEIMHVHCRLAVSKNRTQQKVNHFGTALLKMWFIDTEYQPENGSRKEKSIHEIDTLAKHSGRGHHKLSYQEAYKLLGNLFIHLFGTADTSLSSSVAGGRLQRRRVDLSQAMMWYIDYLRFLNAQTQSPDPNKRYVTTGEVLIIAQFNAAFGLSNSNIRPQISHVPPKSYHQLHSAPMLKTFDDGYGYNTDTTRDSFSDSDSEGERKDLRPSAPPVVVAVPVPDIPVPDIPVAGAVIMDSVGTFASSPVSRRARENYYNSPASASAPSPDYVRTIKSIR